jgi:hypothetical protein
MLIHEFMRCQNAVDYHFQVLDTVKVRESRIHGEIRRVSDIYFSIRFYAQPRADSKLCIYGTYKGFNHFFFVFFTSLLARVILFNLNINFRRQTIVEKLHKALERGLIVLSLPHEHVTFTFLLPLYSPVHPLCFANHFVQRHKHVSP